MENSRTTPGSGTKKPIILYCTSIVLVLLVASIIFVHDIFQYNTGVITAISLVKSGHDTLELRLTYFLPMGGYSVREVPQDEGEYIGDGMIDYDGSLGKYRIIVEFGDMEPHISFGLRRAKDGSFLLNNSVIPLKAKIAHPGDHGFVLYIGSDTPLHVEETGPIRLDGFCGVICIPIQVGDTQP